MKLTSLSFPLLSLVALACNAQVSPDHKGEPLLVLQGQVVANGASPSAPAPAEAALLWMSFDSGAGPFGTLRLAGNSAPVTGNFPYGFQMEVFAPPAAGALLPLGEPVPGGFPLDATMPAETAVASVVALAPNADHANVNPSDILGTSQDSLVVYNSHDIAPASPSGKLLSLFHAPLTPGYHLIAVQQATSAQHAEFVRCKTGGVCVKTHLASGAPDWQVKASDADYADCTAATPSATSCDLWATTSPTPEQSQATNACLELAQARRGKACISGRTFTEAQGATSTTVTMGSTPWEVWR
jgi:hypothetical protein